MDISVFKAVISELARMLPGKKLTEIAEGQAGEFYLLFKGDGKKHSLLISPRPNSHRIHLISEKPRNLRDLSPFGQSMSNILLGSVLQSISQEGLERAALLNFSRKRGKNEERAALVFEMAGKKPELIVLDGNGIIMAAQSYSSLEEAARPVLPGLKYQPPPKPEKLDPHEITGDIINRILSDSSATPPKLLFNKIGGLSPLLARETTAAGDDNPEKLAEALTELLEKVDAAEFQPRIFETEKGPVLAAFPLLQFQDAPFREFSSMNEAVEAFYNEEEAWREFNSAKAGLLKQLKAHFSAALKKVAAIETDLARAGRAEDYQLYGQTLMASLKDVPERAEKVNLTDFSTGENINIPLDPKLGAVRNAEEYFKKAKKARAGEKLLRERLAGAKEELNSIEACIKFAEGVEDMDELAPLLPQAKERGKRKSIKDTVLVFPSFTTLDGFVVMVGKNSKMNDLLTFKAAAPMDLWLHAQGYRGSHVVIKNPSRRPDIPLATILQAAEVAAYYSEGKTEGSVPVDYTFVKYVRKQRDGSPGAVIFTGNKTLFVDPKKRV